jgi:hypothetical protein
MIVSALYARIQRKVKMSKSDVPTRCAKCKKAIKESWASYEGKNYHLDCAEQIFEAEAKEKEQNSTD